MEEGVWERDYTERYSRKEEIKMRWTPDLRKCSDVSKPQQMLLVCILCVINAYLAMVRKLRNAVNWVSEECDSKFKETII